MLLKDYSSLYTLLIKSELIFDSLDNLSATVVAFSLFLAIGLLGISSGISRFFIMEVAWMDWNVGYSILRSRSPSN